MRKHGYLFPDVSFRSGGHVEPRELNRAMLPVAERLMGEVGPHNLAAGIGSALPVAVNAMTRFHLVLDQANPGLTAGGAPVAGASAFTIPPTYEWVLIEDPSGTYDPLRVTITAVGRSVYKIYAWAQYDYSSWASLLFYEPSMVQLGLFVDGALIQGAHTGKVEEFEREFWPVRLISPKGQTTPVQARVIRSRRSDSMGPAAKPVLLSWIVTLEAGSHTVEIRARRAPFSDRRTPLTYNAYIHNAKLLVLEHPQWTAATVGAAVVTVDPIETEDVLNVASIGTSIPLLRTTQNGGVATGLVEGALRRGAMSNLHLPSPLLAVDQGSSLLPAGSLTLSNRYPGFTSSTIAANTGAGATGWWEIDDGAGGNLRATNGGAGFAATDATDASFILVIADISIVALRQRTAITTRNSIFGVFTLGYYSNAAWTMIPAAVGFVNVFNRVIIGGADRIDTPPYTTVSLLGWLDLRSVQLGNDISYFSVFGSTASAVGAGDAIVTIDRGALQVFQYRP